MFSRMRPGWAALLCAGAATLGVSTLGVAAPAHGEPSPRQVEEQLKPLQSRVDAALSDVNVLASRVYIEGGSSGLSGKLISGSPIDLTDKPPSPFPVAS
ncbi:hypothetical protein HH310_14740 [Actinoplanes sp. TBRC 11911]|uniref:hypothetical protein n=1 Tax=Actinoplanes sp. TBRC 11911 TaxID=2729386 RepID=UPI00145DEDD2|nr:hypothetical protein [Actinoplanes sp. TBRC 11911]NMO52444.1 hypothetical protein [Actinoplanes sp. TBRC 11911]